MVDSGGEKAEDYVEKLYTLVNIALERTKTENKEEIEKLLKTATDWEFFFWNSCFTLHHYKRFTGKDKVSDYEERLIDLALSYDTTLIVFIDLWRELGLALRELISANYEAVSRSLRWIIEATVVWADMQLDLPRTSEIYYDLLSMKKKLLMRDYKRKLGETRAANKARFNERLVYREKYHLVKISDTIGKLVILKNRRKGEENHLVRENLLHLYSEFSAYAHCTTASLEEFETPIRHDFSLFQGYEYDKKSFDTWLERIYQTIDSCLSVVLLANTEFYGYETPPKFMDNILEGGPLLAIETCQSTTRFPYLSKVLSQS